jgi:hypothetical protein
MQHHRKTKKELLAALALVAALAGLAGFVRWQQVNSPAQKAVVGQVAAQTNSKVATGPEGNEREETIPGVGDRSRGEGPDLISLAEYWNAHVTFPTGRFDGAWLLQAAAQDRLIAAGIPAGEVTYNRSRNQSPLALDPLSFVLLGPRPAQSDGCYSCFNYGKVSGRINTIAIDPTMSSTVYIGMVGGGVWKTTNCCSINTAWTSTMDDPLISTLGLDEITIDPNNHNTIYVATGDFRNNLFGFGANGILRSTNAGNSWTVLGANVFTPTYELAPSIPNPYRWQYQAVSAVKVDPRNSNTLIAGTKSGVFFSYNAGSTWTGPCFTNAFTQTQRQDTTELLVQNNGTSTTIYTAIGYPFGTGPGGTTVANGANGVYSTTVPVSGCPATWQLLTTDTNGWPAGTGNGTESNSKPGRIDLAIAPSNPNVLYAEVSNANSANPGLLGLWRTTDRGVTWQQRATAASLRDCQGAPGDYPQNWYDQGLDVDPNNSDVIYMDTFDVWKSTDGGLTLFDVSCGYSGGTTIHVDQHDTRYVPGSSSTLLQGNDGGIYVTHNADVISPTRPTWQQMNETLSTLEFYGGDVTGNFATAPQPGANGGTQDNGSFVTVWNNPPSIGPQQWQLRAGGDGMFARIEPVFNQRWYQESQNGNLQVSVSGPFGPLASARGPANWGGDTRSFVMPYEIYRGNPSDPANDCNLATGCTHMIAGTTRVWETLQGAVPASSWYTNSLNLTRGVAGRNYINSVRYATSMSTTAMVGTMDGYVWYGFGLGQGTPLSASWVNVTTDTTSLALPERPIMDVRTDPVNPLVGYAVLAGFDQNTPGKPGHVFQITCTANCASSAWVNKTGNLPNIPINTIAPNPRFPQQVFAGSDFGLYYTNDITAGSPTWFRFNAGLPNVKVWELTVDRGFTTLVAWTRGRGAFAWPLPNSPFVQPSATPTVTGTPPTATRTPRLTPSATATSGPCFTYSVMTGTTTIISGTTDIGNHCDDCATTVQLPFPVTFYDQTFTQGFANSNGSFIFGPATASLYNNCLPDRNSQYAVIAYQNDLCTTGCGSQPSCPTCGIYTATLGTAPNRQFVLEWRALHFDPAQGAGPANFEIIFTEGSSTVSTVYGVTGDNGQYETIGVQQTSDTRWTQYSCNTASLTPGLRVDYIRGACATATPGTTSTATRTPTSVVTPVTTCPPGTPTRIATPAFTPAPGCNGRPTGNQLRGDITVTGNTSVAVFTNRSNTCSFPIGLASYQRFDNNIDHQELYDYRLAVIPPNSTLTLTVNNPPCSFQVDAFWGDILYSLNGQRYGQRLLQDEVHMNGGYCTVHCNVPPPTSTAVVATSTAVAATNTPGAATSTAVAATNTPGATRTAVVATNTPGATGTPILNVCTFTDVDPSNPFYAFVRCLACRNIVSGYGDGSFRPNADVTRGQLAKILANAAGLTDAIPATQQTFADVPSNNPFWLFIERLAAHDAINGYSCGGAGEGCDAQNRPYFRWGANANRGQIAKITALAAGYMESIPTTRQTFSDVPSSSPFWLWIEQLAAQGVINGYSDGTFRWGANATRGQMTKIGAQAFFPGCQ